MEDSSEIKDQLIKNTAWGMISSLLNRVGGFILVILVSRMLLPERFGRYSLAMTIALFLITFSDLGINQTLIRYVSLEFDKDKKKAITYFKHLFKMRFFLTIVSSLALLIGAYPLSHYVFKDVNLFLPLVILSFYVFFISLTSFFESLFFIKKNVKYLSVKEFFSIIFRVVCIIAIWFFVLPNSKLNWIFISLACFSIFAFIFIFYFSKKKYALLFKEKECEIDKKDISRFILFTNVQNISLLVLAHVSIILLGIFLTSEFVGYYNSSWVLVSGIISLLFSFSYIFLPIFTNAKEETFQAILKKIFRISIVVALPISFGLSLLSKFFIITIYGEAYLPSVASLSVLSFIIPLMMGINLTLDAFSARNKQKKFATIILLFASALILLNCFFISFLSKFSGEITILGISILNAILWIFCFICAVYLLKKELNVNILSKDLIKPVIACFVMSAFILSSLRLLGDLNLFSGIILIIISIGIYFSFLFLIKGITKEDFAMFSRMFKK
jgi:stage V sporulation protein B